MNGFVKFLAVLVFSTVMINSSHAQVYKEGDVVIDGYYGFPNLWSWNFATITSGNSAYTNPKFLSIGPVGGRVEFMLTEMIGVGVDASYAYSNIKYNYNDGTSVTPPLYDLTITRYRVVPRASIHFGKHTKVDPYVTFGVGYFHRDVVETPNNPDLTVSQAVAPITILGKFGLRYFFTEHVGFGFEVGMGGPLATLGLTGKF